MSDDRWADLDLRIKALEALMQPKPAWSRNDRNEQKCPGCGQPLYDDHGSVGRLYGTLPDGSTWHSICHAKK
jgi:hypothetical protein